MTKEMYKKKIKKCTCGPSLLELITPNQKKKKKKREQENKTQRKSCCCVNQVKGKESERKIEQQVSEDMTREK
jgi:hypothetical protein